MARIRTRWTKLLMLNASMIAVFLVSACAEVTTRSASLSDADGASGAESPVSESAPAVDTDDSITVPTSVESDGDEQDTASTNDGVRRSGDSSDGADTEEPDETEGAISPSRLKIDALDIDSHIERVGITDDGAMDVPREWENVGWYEPGTVPGERGNAVMAGHFDSPTSPAVFYELGELEIGDRITVVSDDERELVFEVTEIEMVEVDNAPLDKIFGNNTEQRNLNLITCDGVWNAETETYESRLIVYTTLVDR